MAEESAKTFFSYAREDSEFVLRLVKDLRASGAAVWLDQLDIGPGQRWDTEVEKALHESPRQVTVLSPAAVASQNVMDEVAYALDEGKHVIPLLSKECPIPFRLRRLQYIDFRTDYAAGLRDLLKALRAGRETADWARTSQQQPMVSEGAEVGKAIRARAIPEVPLPVEKAGGAGGRRKKLWIAAAATLAGALALGAWFMYKHRPEPGPTSSSGGSQGNVSIGDAKAIYQRGMDSFNQGQYDQAILQFDQAILLKPDFADAFDARGFTYMLKQQYDRAIEDFDQALHLRPDYPEAFNNRGLTHWRMKKFDLAIQDYTRAIQARPAEQWIPQNRAAVFINRGEAYFSSGHYELAIRDYDQALQLQPNNADAVAKRNAAVTAEAEKQKREH